MASPYVGNDNPLIYFPALFGGTFGTSTASETGTLATTLVLPVMPMKFAMKFIRVRVVTAPAANNTVTLLFMNGTDTLAAAAMAGKSAGDWVSAVAVGYTGAAATEDELTDAIGTMTPPTGPGVNQFLGRNSKSEIAAAGQLTLKALSTATASAMVSGVYDIWFAGKQIG